MKDEILNEVGARMYSARTEKKLTQYQVATLAGIERRQYQRIEHGKVDCGISKIALAAAALGISLDNLVKNRSG